MLIFTDDQVNPQYHGFPDFNYNTLFLRDHDIMCLSTYHQLLFRCKNYRVLGEGCCEVLEVVQGYDVAKHQSLNMHPNFDIQNY